jgi:transcriptional regulator with XRE-family HTH domain
MPCFFHPLTDGCLMPQIRATATVPPSASMTLIASDCLSMPLSIGVPIGKSIGNPVGQTLNLSYMTLRERLASAMAGPPRISQAALARACKVAQPSVNDWLSGKTKMIGGERLLRVAAHLNVNASWLATGKGSRDVNVKNRDADARTESHIQVLDASNLARALVWLLFEEKAAGHLAQPLRRAERLIALYEMIIADGGELTPEHAAQLIDATRQSTGVEYGKNSKRAGKQA